MASVAVHTIPIPNSSSLLYSTTALLLLLLLILAKSPAPLHTQ